MYTIITRRNSDDGGPPSNYGVTIRGEGLSLSDAVGLYMSLLREFGQSYTVQLLCAVKLSVVVYDEHGDVRGEVPLA